MIDEVVTDRPGLSSANRGLTETSSIIDQQSSLRRLALLIEYDGGAYGGSQRQRNAPSIQAALEAALERLNGRQTRAAFAGRTDSGVHARGQVAAFDAAVHHSIETWQRALNGLLPRDIAVRSVAEVPQQFDPRRDAVSREYVYRIWNEPVRSPLVARVAWHVAGALDRALIAEVARSLIGEHDFAAFGGLLEPGRSSRRRILRIALSAAGGCVTVTVEGDAFLPHQVRRTVGALVEVGRGRLVPEQIAEWLVRPVPGAAGPAAPAHGLCLMRVRYAGCGPRFRGDDVDEG